MAGLEVNGRVTEVIGVPGFNLASEQGYGNYKDKAVDLKYQIVPEGKYIPAIALGIMDPSGTRVYASQYIVASKQIYPFDFTIGFGNGRFGKSQLSASGQGIRAEMLTDPKAWLRESQFFYGIQFAPSERYSLMVEYSPIMYDKQTSDPAQPKYFQRPVPSHFNFGFRWRPVDWAELGLSYQRGNRVGVSLAVAFDIGRPLLPIYDAPYKEKPEERLRSVPDRIATALAASGFSDISVSIHTGDLLIEAQNDRYYYAPRAVGVISEVVVGIAPSDVNNVRIVLKENGIPRVEVACMMSDLTELYAERLTAREFLYLSNVRSDITELSDIPGRYRKLFDYGIKPTIQTLLNDPSGYFKFRAGIAAWVSHQPWKGALLVTGIEGYPLNNVSTINEPLSIPVRSDIALYKKQSVSLSRLMYDQIYKMPGELYWRISAGLLEIEYAGLDGEVAMPLYGGRLMVGLGGSALKKREPSNPFALKNDDVKSLYTTAFVNTRFNFVDSEFSVDLKAGRFLAGDLGGRITLSKFINGVIISAWYGVADTSKFTDRFNKGYHDAGISVTIPLRLFKGSDSRTSYMYSLSPWTRDVAQDIDHYRTLFDFMGRYNKAYFDKDAGRMVK